MQIVVESFAVSPRRALRPGMSFRVRRGSGPYLTTTGEPAGAESGEYRCLRLWRETRRPARVYCDAVGRDSGREHTLYLAGPVHRCPVLEALMIRPYAITLANAAPPERVAKSPRRKRLVH